MALVESNSNQWSKSGDKKSPNRLSQLRLLINMFRDYYAKRYTEMSKWTLISIGFGLLYLFSPIDIIPDIAFPIIGFIDDAAVLALVTRQVGKELKRYEIWRNSQDK